MNQPSRGRKWTPAPMPAIHLSRPPQGNELGRGKTFSGTSGKPWRPVSDTQVSCVTPMRCFTRKTSSIRNAAMPSPRAVGRRVVLAFWKHRVHHPAFVQLVLVAQPYGFVFVSPSREQVGLDGIFKEAGFEWREAGCSMCLGMNDDVLGAGERCASTSNRNFEGRQGRGSRTHLVSPAMAAAAAIAGHFVDIRRWGDA